MKILSFLLVLAFFPLISAVTMQSGDIIHSSGLNSNFTLTYSISYDKLIVDTNSITFYNLSYTIPGQCSSFHTLYNYATSNTEAVFPITACGGGGVGDYSWISCYKVAGGECFYERIDDQEDCPSGYFQTIGACEDSLETEQTIVDKIKEFFSNIISDDEENVQERKFNKNWLFVGLGILIVAWIIRSSK